MTTSMEEIRSITVPGTNTHQPHAHYRVLRRPPIVLDVRKRATQFLDYQSVTHTSSSDDVRCERPIVLDAREREKQFLDYKSATRNPFQSCCALRPPPIGRQYILEQVPHWANLADVTAFVRRVAGDLQILVAVRGIAMHSRGCFEFTLHADDEDLAVFDRFFQDNSIAFNTVGDIVVIPSTTMHRDAFRDMCPHIPELYNYDPVHPLTLQQL